MIRLAGEEKMMNRCSGWWVFLVLLSQASGALAQEIPDLFQFRFANPGARSLGFGGAFAARADDATAAYANPAGLVKLVDPEFFFELRFTRFRGEEFSDFDVSTLGFLSFVYPHKNWSVAIYEAGLGRSEASLGLSGFLIGPDFGPRASSSLSVENQGIAGAYRWSENFSIGLGFARFDGEFDAVSERFPTAQPGSSEEQFLTVTTVEDTDVSVNAGFLWRRPGRWDFAGFFRQGPSFVLDSRLTVVTPEAPAGMVVDIDPRIPFDLADIFGFGVSYQSKNGALTASFEWDRVGSAGGLDSGDELHLGLELVVLRTSPVLALRLGAWRDPDRRSGTDSDFPTVFPDGDGEIHFAGGLGFAFKNLKIDVAFDQADRVDTGSFSLVYAF